MGNHPAPTISIPKCMKFNFISIALKPLLTNILTCGRIYHEWKEGHIIKMPKRKPQPVHQLERCHPAYHNQQNRRHHYPKKIS